MRITDHLSFWADITRVCHLLSTIVSRATRSYRIYIKAPVYIIVYTCIPYIYTNLTTRGCANNPQSPLSIWWGKPRLLLFVPLSCPVTLKISPRRFPIQESSRARTSSNTMKNKKTSARSSHSPARCHVAAELYNTLLRESRPDQRHTHAQTLNSYYTHCWLQTGESGWSWVCPRRRSASCSTRWAVL